MTLSLRTFYAKTSRGDVVVQATHYSAAYRAIVNQYGLNIEIYNIELGV